MEAEWDIGKLLLFAISEDEGALTLECCDDDDGTADVAVLGNIFEEAFMGLILGPIPLLRDVGFIPRPGCPPLDPEEDPPAPDFICAFFTVSLTGPQAGQ